MRKTSRRILIVIAVCLVVMAGLPAAAQDDGVVMSEEAQEFYSAARLSGLFYIDFALDAIPNTRARMSTLGSFAPPLQDVAIEAVDAGGVPAEWFTPPDAGTGVILYTHGGGYVVGTVASYRAMLSRLAKIGGLRVLAIEYRLAPEFPFPAAVEDSTAAYRWLLAQSAAPERIVLAGDSAGGGLAAATLLALREAGDPLPAAAVLFSPFADLTGAGTTLTTLAGADPILAWEDSLEEAAAAYAGDTDPHDPLISPVYADLHGLPPLLILVGSNEILLSDSTRLARRARLAGVDVTLDVWEGMVHVWPLFGVTLPESWAALEAASAFAQAHLKP
ncbi:MAG: alpha/beta hydrolase [Anaerolineae bacterium]|nr:alpha/beta hydrolase [Anaerolineae bacterium]